MRFAPIFALIFLAGCDVAQEAADDLARDRAKSVVNGVVAQQMPGVNVAPATDCVIENASAGEILKIAQASVTGVTQSTTTLVVEIAKRPETLKCFLQNSLKLL